LNDRKESIINVSEGLTIISCYFVPHDNDITDTRRSLPDFANFPYRPISSCPSPLQKTHFLNVLRGGRVLTRTNNAVSSRNDSPPWKANKL